MGLMHKPTLTVEIAPGVPMDFVLIRPGVFIMGDAKDGDADEQPEHWVSITRPFYLGRYPVTQVQWAAVMGKNPANFKGNDRHPVESVSWNDTMGTASATAGFLKRLPQVWGYAYRLATGAEWEYAAKGGHLAPPVVSRAGGNQASAENLYPTYAGGEDVNAAAWQDRNNAYSTLRSGYRQPNALGLYGMSGNVYEWCQDTFDREAYVKRTQNWREISDPLAEERGLLRAVRGGSWIDYPGYCRPASRSHRHFMGRSLYDGFRLVLAPSLARDGSILEPG